MSTITYCGGCIRQEEIAALEAEVAALRGVKAVAEKLLSKVQPRPPGCGLGVGGIADAQLATYLPLLDDLRREIRLAPAPARKYGVAREEFLEGRVADLAAALAEAQARLKAWQRAEAMVYEITPAGREALARYREGA